MAKGPLALDSPFLSEEQRAWNSRVHVTPRGTPLAGPSQAELDEIDVRTSKELAADLARKRWWLRSYLGFAAVMGFVFLVSVVNERMHVPPVPVVMPTPTPGSVRPVVAPTPVPVRSAAPLPVSTSSVSVPSSLPPL